MQFRGPIRPLCWWDRRRIGGAEARPAMDERPGMIEIDLPDGTRLRVDAFVNERALRRVLVGIAGHCHDPDDAGHEGLSGLPPGQHASRV